LGLRDRIIENPSRELTGKWNKKTGCIKNNDAACLYFYMTSNDQDCFSTPPELSSFSKRRSNFTEANDEL